MSTDRIRALLAETAVELDSYYIGMRGNDMSHPLAREARAALSEPADGPAAVAGQPTDEELLGMAAHTIAPYDWIEPGEYEEEQNRAVHIYGSELCAFARAVLSRWGNHSPDATKMVAPASDLIAELIPELRKVAEHLRDCNFRGFSNYATCAAEQLERQAAPVPVPVTERLPGPEDCDESGMCWWLHAGEDGIGDWIQRKPYPGAIASGFFRMTHWLPAHALPLPAQGGEVQPDA